MKVIGWFLILVGSLSLPSIFQSFKLSDFSLAMIFIIWGILSIQYKKHLMKKDIYIGTRYLDGSFLFFGVFLLGLGVFDLTLILKNGLPDTDEKTVSSVILLLLFFLGGSLLTIKGYKKYLANKKIDSDNPSDTYIRSRYE